MCHCIQLPKYGEEVLALGPFHSSFAELHTCTVADPGIGRGGGTGEGVARGGAK